MRFQDKPRSRQAVRQSILKPLSLPAGRWIRKLGLSIEIRRAAGLRDATEYARRVLGNESRRSVEMHGLEFQRRIEEAGDVLWIAVWRGKVMGHTWVSKMWSFEGIVSWFSGGTWVHPFFRGIGVGRRLIEGSLGDACGSGKKQIYGNISADNSFSLAMCERAGFRRISKPQWSRIIQDSYRRRTGTAKAQVIVVYDCDRTDGDRS